MRGESVNLINLGVEVFPILSKALSEAGRSDVGAFPVMAPENTNGTIVVFARDKVSTPETYMGGRECQLLVRVVSEEYDDGVSVAEIVHDALSGADKLRMILSDMTEFFNDNKFYQEMSFNVEFF